MRLYSTNTLMEPHRFQQSELAKHHPSNNHTKHMSFLMKMQTFVKKHSIFETIRKPTLTTCMSEAPIDAALSH